MVEGKIEIVQGTSHCTYSVIENKLKILSQNQKVLYDMLEEILDKINKTPHRPKNNTIK